ncbi:MAG: flagellar hook assembly protein FlgD [Alphaproteobacteria bacterium]|nr:flagellar hook assembly protein FlgD [Alphaproteobacteria bacterium]MBU1513408.1 flagellar hook assembly protein FlgD [Alphaproteobacteria bacterium]MBU2096400.1 flagellar hook assembly protein FlgD [Alphaproteobacteria bacterium]MBU2149908.1 flagellar hook assembly protein FlgD [Alphaproteobacteria bacterium]MBU2309894.1 flagellar hook assembly protein FlgD [Alphaproteobacteria bacterium]
MVDAVAGAAAGAATGTGRARLAENFDTFLSLLTTQLKNQDPLAPMDSTQFTQQLVQMTGVEQQLLTNDLLGKLVSNTGTGVSTAVSLIGKEVRADTNIAALKGGKAEWGYSLDRAASDVKLEILDSKGRVVRTIAPTDNKIGEHKLTWDGKGAGGTDLPDGTYSLKVTAKDSEGTAVVSKTFSDGKVTGVEQQDGLTYLTINGALVPWDKLVSIRQPAETATAATETGSPNNSDDKTSSPAAA